LAFQQLKKPSLRSRMEENLRRRRNAYLNDCFCCNGGDVGGGMGRGDGVDRNWNPALNQRLLTSRKGWLQRPGPLRVRASLGLRPTRPMRVRFLQLCSSSILKPHRTLTERRLRPSLNDKALKVKKPRHGPQTNDNFRAILPPHRQTMLRTLRNSFP
jgi:hypothetical protein